MEKRSFSFTVSITLLLSIMIPSILISQYIYINLKGAYKREAYREISRVRDEKVKKIKNFYFQEFNSFEKIIDRVSKNVPLSTNERELKYLFDFQPNIMQVVMYDYNFKPLININRGGVSSLDSIPETVRVTIQKNFYFSKYFLKDLLMEDGSSSLIFFYKEVSGDRYFSITLDYDYLNSFLEEFGDIKIDIYNDKYQIVASSNIENDSRRVYNNPLTEKIITGLTDNILYKGSYNSFTHIDLGGEKLFINTRIKKSLIDNKSRSIKISLFFFYLLFIMAALLVGSILTRFFYHIKESFIREEIFSNRFSFFYRINRTIKYIDERFIEVQKLYKAMNYFKNDISTILDELPGEESSEDQEFK